MSLIEGMLSADRAWVAGKEDEADEEEREVGEDEVEGQEEEGHSKREEEDEEDEGPATSPDASTSSPTGDMIRKRLNKLHCA